MLEVPQTATANDIKKSYRRLALAIHPDKNSGSREKAATEAFQKLSSAYETLSDKEKRIAYDRIWTRIRDTLWKQKREASLRAEAEAKRRDNEAREKAEKQREEAVRNPRSKFKSLLPTRKENLLKNQRLKQTCDRDVFELNRSIRVIGLDLKQIETLNEEENKRERQKNSWWAYIQSPFYARPKETEDQKMSQQYAKYQRLSSQRIKKEELDRKQKELDGVQIKLDEVNHKIEAEKAIQARIQAERARDQAAARLEELKKEKQAREQAQAERIREEIRLQAEKLRKEQEARNEQERRWKAAWDAEERTRKAAEKQRAEEAARYARDEREAREAREKLAREKLARQQEKARREKATQKPRAPHKFDSNRSSCSHARFWTKTYDSLQCSRCNRVQRYYAFQCPECSIVACASCREVLKRQQPGEVRLHLVDIRPSVMRPMIIKMITTGISM
ncbi:MAG: hypothetical protein M1829_005363 [Trizodia sp. TS-e1964]|nr:MAG: hypothetical protein M1829_005363 [Trizodia sp. TS-e1964]